MAKLLIQGGFTAIGSYFGGAIGGAAGGFIGGMVANAAFPEKPVQVGPKITDFTVVSTAFGEVIRDGWGTMAYPGHLIDSTDLQPHKHNQTAESSGGKGMSQGPKQFFYSYSVNAAFLFRRRQAAGFLRVWMDTKLIRNVSPTATLSEVIASNFSWKGGSLTLYNGAEDQLPAPELEQLHGVGNVPAYRGMVCLVANQLDLTDFANRVPTISAEIYDSGSSGLTEVLPIAGSDPHGGNAATWCNVDANGEILQLISKAPGASYNPVNDASTILIRITPEGEFFEQKIFDLDNPRAGPMPGLSDVPGYAIYGSDGTHNGYFFYDYILKTRSFFYHPADFTGFFYLYNLGVFYVYTKSANFIYEFAAPGAVTRQMDVAFLGFDFEDWGATTDFIYIVLTTGVDANPHSIYKISRETLTVVGSPFTPTIPDNSNPGVQAKAAISVFDDTLIYLTSNFNNNNLTLYRYYLVTNITVDLGTVAISGGEVFQHDKRMVVSNGVLYWGPQWSGTAPAPRIHRFVIQGSGQSTLLSTIVGNLCRYAGLAASRYDVSELIDVVWGYERDAQSTPADMIKALMNTYFFDACEADGKIKFKKRGRALSYSIPRGDVAAHEQGQKMPEKAATKQIQERQMPTQLRVTYIMKDHDYEKGMQYEERIITDFRNVVEVASPVALSDTEARQVAGKLMPIMWAERNNRQIALSRKYVKLEVADAFEVTI